MLSQESFAFIDRCVAELEHRGQDLEQTKYEIQKFIEDNVLSQLSLKNILFHARVKEPSSLREKIIRKNAFIGPQDEVKFIDELDDLIGVRLVCLLQKEEEELFRQLDQKVFLESDQSGLSIVPGTLEARPYLRLNKTNQPDIQKNGKKIFKMKGQWVTETKILNVEIQLKSLSHTFWGEVEHMLFYKNYAYMVGSGFYKDIMNSIGEMLHSIDHQLEALRDHLSVNDETQQIEEIKQMVTKLMYSVYQPAVNTMLRSEVDLKQVYELVAELLFIRIYRRDFASAKAAEVINRINTGVAQLTPDSFIFGQYNEHRSHSNLKELAAFIGGLAKSQDIFWKTFIAVYMLIKQETDFTTVCDNITSELMSLYAAYQDEFIDLDNIGVSLLSNSIQGAVISYFFNYKKIDYFLPNVFQKKILDAITQFINNHQHEFSDIKPALINPENEEHVKNLVAFYLKLMIDLVVNKQIKVDELRMLNDWLNNKEKDWLWIPSVNTDELSILISKQNNVDEKQFKKLYEKK
ncbi:hypothetical protein [Paenibacillus sp. NRS-1760]|uniref:hypothetical protein n=1 Tax=Paenibacillus sp. NRS-1760 TaxID=3233902 RepID=UPI003D2C1796